MRTHVTGILLACSLAAFAASPSFAAKGMTLKKGDKLQTLANLHPDMNKHLLYTLNYQLPGMIPACADVTLTKVRKKGLAFDYQGQVFELAYEAFTKKAGVSFEDAARSYFGAACDRTGMQALGQADQEGVRVGRPKLGMSRKGVLFAMGRPPHHANPDLNAPSFTYWRNRFARMIITFDAAGKVIEIQ
jgi:hypothetical protein